MSRPTITVALVRAKDVRVGDIVRVPAGAGAYRKSGPPHVRKAGTWAPSRAAADAGWCYVYTTHAEPGETPDPEFLALDRDAGLDDRAVALRLADDRPGTPEGSDLYAAFNGHDLLEIQVEVPPVGPATGNAG